MTISLIAIGLVIMYCLMCCFTDSYVRKKEYVILAGIFMVASAYIAYLFTPTATMSLSDDASSALWDMSRYYVEINTIKQYAFSRVVQIGAASIEPLRYILWYILGNYASARWLQVLSIICGVSSVVYCSMKCDTDNNYIYADNALFSFILLFAGISFFEMINTGRCVIAYFFVVVGITKIYSKSQMWIGVALIILAALLHNSCWAILILLLFAPLFYLTGKKKTVFILWRLLTDWIASILYRIPYERISNLGNKIQSSLSEGRELTVNRIIYSLVVLVLGFSLYFIIEHQKDIAQERKQKGLLDFIQVLLIFAMGGVNTTIGVRLLYLVVMLSPFYILNNTRASFNMRRVSLWMLVSRGSAFALLTYNLLVGIRYFYLAGSYFGS